MQIFIGREYELQKLNELTMFNRPTIAVIKGRRRIGKSRLVEEFAKDKIFISLTGKSPLEDTTEQDQRDIFAQQLTEYMPPPAAPLTSWFDAYYYLSKHLTQEPTVVFLDEISWMGSKDPKFIPIMKIWWDKELQKFPNLTLIFSGSISTWIEENIINSTSFYGRITLKMTLYPLSITESTAFLRARDYQMGEYDMCRLMCVLGGVPWYLEQVQPRMDAEKNIQNLCFQPNGLLVDEFQTLFHDLFNGRGSTYKLILNSLAKGMKTLADIREDIQYSDGGTLSHMLDHLVTSGFVSKHPHWSFKTGKQGRQSLYRIDDPYTRFYLKYIEPHLDSIRKKGGVNLHKVIGFDSAIGLQFETLMIQNRDLLDNAMDLLGMGYVGHGPYVQKATKTHKVCQIDYLVQTRARNLIMCEFKFTSRKINSEIYKEIEEKMKALSVPRNFGLVPVLVYMGEISPDVDMNPFFYRTISVEQFMKQPRK